MAYFDGFRITEKNSLFTPDLHNEKRRKPPCVYHVRLNSRPIDSDMTALYLLYFNYFCTSKKMNDE